MRLYQFTRHLGWPLLTLLCLLPVWRWAVMQPLGYRFDGPIISLLSIGQLAGIIGLTLFAFNLLLTTRFKIFEDLFGGLNKVFIAHHIIGTIAFLALLAHPLMLSLRLLPSSAHEAAWLLVPTLDNLPVAFGILALLGLITIMWITFFAAWQYRTWLFAHKFLGGVFFLAGLHVLLTPNDLSEDRLLQVYLLGLAALGLLAYTYRTLFPGVFIKRYGYTVTQAKNLGGATVEISLAPIKRGIKFEAGQFIFISIRAEGFSSEWHPFTISSAPSDAGLAITVKSLGQYTDALTRSLNTLPGKAVKIEGAYGRFEFKDVGGPNQIWIAGGIGITPFLSLARSLAVSESTYHVDLYYSVKTESELISMDILQNATMNTPARSFRVIPYVADKQGFITAKFISDTSGGVAGKEILLCGPQPMMTALRRQFKALYVPKNRIHSEEFALQ